MTQPIDLQSMTVEQLKALAYDQLRQLQQVQANIQAIEKVIQEKESKQEAQ